jgi:hypothetical protein
LDGFYFLHLLINVPSSYGNIAKLILQTVCRTQAVEIHLIFDTYKSPSIKDIERQNRSISSQHQNTYKINGPNQQRSAEFSELLKNSSFKKTFVDFLTTYFKNAETAQILGQKKLYVTNNVKCFSFQTECDKILTTEVEHLRCLHEEADSRIMYHIV